MLSYTSFLAAGLAKGTACAASLFHWHCFIVHRAHGVKTNRGTIGVGLTPQFTSALLGGWFCELEGAGALGMGFVYARCGVVGKLLLRSAVTKDRISSLENSSRLVAQLGQRWCSLPYPASLHPRLFTSSPSPPNPDRFLTVRHRA
jgi:hypothetical protein